MASDDGPKGKGTAPPAWWDLSMSSASGADPKLNDEIAALRDKIREDRAAKAPATSVEGKAFLDDSSVVSRSVVSGELPFSDRTDVGVVLPNAEPSVAIRVPVLHPDSLGGITDPVVTAPPDDYSPTTDPGFKPGVPDPNGFTSEGDSTNVAPPPTGFGGPPMVGAAGPPRAGAPAMVGAPAPVGSHASPPAPALRGAPAPAYPGYAPAAATGYAPAPAAHAPPPAHGFAPAPAPAAYAPAPAPAAYAPAPATGFAPAPATGFAPSPAPAQYTPPPAPIEQAPRPAPLDELPSVRLNPDLVARRPTAAPPPPDKPLLSDDAIRIGVWVVGGLIVLMVCVIIVGVLVSMLSEEPTTLRLVEPPIVETV